jgi:hypothetical protein
MKESLKWHILAETGDEDKAESIAERWSGHINKDRMTNYILLEHELRNEVKELVRGEHIVLRNHVRHHTELPWHVGMSPAGEHEIYYMHAAKVRDGILWLDAYSMDNDNKKNPSSFTVHSLPVGALLKIIEIIKTI